MAEQHRKEDLLKLLNREASKIAWQDMQKHFASGNVVQVDASLDLLDTASEIALDNASMLEGWMQKGLVGSVSDKQAQEWYERNAIVWAIVIAPWVLVQAVKT